MNWQAHRDELERELVSFPAVSFEALALKVFLFQARHNRIYREYLSLLGVRPEAVDSIEKIPFLPVSLFKTQSIQTGVWTPEIEFTSSGTTAFQTSRHLVKDSGFYRSNTERCFNAFYGPVDSYCFLALLPSYLEREGSSLVFMASHFIDRSPYIQSGFFLYDWNKLLEALDECREEKIPVVLLGVSFALLDLAERHPVQMPGAIVMETGGMKGRRKEITREELHRQLRGAFGVGAIHSEYGMTEMLSQAYSRGGGRFFPSPLMRAATREITDPLSPQDPGRLGVLNIIDLANLDTCSFIATDDLGKVYPDGTFEVLGRLDNSDIRGCNLLIS